MGNKKVIIDGIQYVPLDQKKLPEKLASLQKALTEEVWGEYASVEDMIEETWVHITPHPDPSLTDMKTHKARTLKDLFAELLSQ